VRALGAFAVANAPPTDGAARCLIIAPARVIFRSLADKVDQGTSRLRQESLPTDRLWRGSSFLASIFLGMVLEDPGVSGCQGETNYFHSHATPKLGALVAFVIRRTRHCTM
jgi:hypothetical protein